MVAIIKNLLTAVNAAHCSECRPDLIIVSEMSII